MKYTFFLVLTLALSSLSCAQRVRIGAEILIDQKLGLLSGKRVGIICNQTSAMPDGVRLVDTLRKKGIRVTALFSPEHGIRGTALAGAGQDDTADAATGLRVYSLYGKTRKPTAEMLSNVDVLLFDLQDVGARFYTYASTMAYAMQAAAENGKKFIVLDRPNPLGGISLEGPVLDTALRSFVGLFPVPIRHGLTIGEMARMVAGERWLNNLDSLDLTIVPMEAWKREMWYDDTRLPWIPPSPDMRTPVTAVVYPGTCLFEATNISEGRGTDHPFEYIGAPWIDGDQLSREFQPEEFPGVILQSIHFTPHRDQAAPYDPKYQNRQYNGLALVVTDRSAFNPVETAVRIMCRIRELYPDSLVIRESQMKRLWGHPAMPCADESADNTALFDHVRRKYLLY